MHCKSKRARKSALALLERVLCGDIRSLMYLFVIGMIPLSKRIPDMGISGPLGEEPDRKSSLGYLGIKNLGCICYMIAML